MFHIDRSDPAPVETQLVGSVRAALEAGLLAPGDELPTVRQLAVELRVNANAVERAYTELERAGLVRRTPGLGVFVADAERPDERVRLEQLTALEDGFLEQATALGFTLDEIIIHLDSRRRR